MKNCLSFLRNLPCAFFEHLNCETSAETPFNFRVIASVVTATKQSSDDLRGSRNTLKSIHTRKQGIPAQHQPMDTKPPFNPRASLRATNGSAAIQKSAFSLVEMLMALLVASLLLAALAPVMTKRMDEAKINISGVGAAQYDKDSIISIFTGAEGEDKEFNLPSDVNMVKVTLVGGGGAGGNSFFGKQEVTTSKSWTVPQGVTKLRVFMLGGGGGGASGGVGVGTAYADIPATTASETCITKDEGAHTVTIPSNASWIVPELFSACQSGGLTETDRTKWTLVADGTTTYTPGETAGAELKVTACGGGGGGGGNDSSKSLSGSGGSGGYVEKMLVTTETNTIYVKVGGGGGGGGSCSTGIPTTGGCFAGSGGGGHERPGASASSCGGISGGAGGTGAYNGSCRTGSTAGTTGAGAALSSPGTAPDYASKGASGTVWAGGGGGGGACNGGGGGGGGPTTISTVSGTDKDKIIFQIGGGGGGGGGGSDGGADGSGGGGGGGGYGGGGGGGGGGRTSYGSGGSGYKPLFASLNSEQTGLNGTASYLGGAGGGGFGGKRGNNGSTSTATGVAGGAIGANTIWKSSSYCDGGKSGGYSSGYVAGTKGKPGRIEICYGTSGVRTNALKCTYSLPANGSGGGGAGQLVVGEINVTPGETLYFEIGAGGASQVEAGKDGKTGYATNIRRGGPSGAIIAQALGGLPGHYSSAENTESQGGSYRVNTAVGTGQTLDDNWTGVSYGAQSGTGTNGKLANALINKGYGGAGGSSQNMKGETLQGGVGGNSVKNGASPDIKAYGAGGGGGSGAQVAGDAHGIGAAGASGYIYFEYGGTNGGGGTTGEVVTKLLTNLKNGTVIGINVGDGGDNSTGDGNGKETSITYSTGSEKSVKARGGLRGNDGGMGLNEQAAEKALPCEGANKYANCADPLTKGGGGNPTYGGIGGYLEHLYENTDGTWANYIKAKDGTVGGPITGGCGGNLATLTAGITCNDPSNSPNGKAGSFGGGGGGGAVVSETGGLGGKGGKGMVIIEYKSVAL